MRIRALPCLVAVLTATACSPPVDQPAEADRSAARDLTTPMQTDKTSYVLVRDSLGWGTQMYFQFRNVATDTLYAVNCNGAMRQAHLSVGCAHLTGGRRA